ncbi:MAG: pyridoxamine 5'-phosphate oxidase family protein [Saccharofermentanales bacterium]
MDIESEARHLHGNLRPLHHWGPRHRSIFLCANEGHKIDSIIRNDKVSFVVIAQDIIVPDKFDTHFRSVSIFGKARILETDFEKQQALKLLVKKYSPADDE